MGLTRLLQNDIWRPGPYCVWPRPARLVPHHPLLHIAVRRSTRLHLHAWTQDRHEADDSGSLQFWVCLFFIWRKSERLLLYPRQKADRCRRYFVSIPVLLNIATLTGFVVILCVIGGQCLSAVSGDSLSSTVGIVIISVLSLLISFCGFRVLHAYEMWASIPALIAIIIAIGCGGHGLKKQEAAPAPANAPDVLGFGMIVASYTIPWSCIASDFTTYFDPKVSSYVYTRYISSPYLCSN